MTPSTVRVILPPGGGMRRPRPVDPSDEASEVGDVC